MPRSELTIGSARRVLHGLLPWGRLRLSTILLLSLQLCDDLLAELLLVGAQVAAGALEQVLLAMPPDDLLTGRIRRHHALVGAAILAGAHLLHEGSEGGVERLSMAHLCAVEVVLQADRRDLLRERLLDRPENGLGILKQLGRDVALLWLWPLRLLKTALVLLTTLALFAQLTQQSLLAGREVLLVASRLTLLLVLVARLHLRLVPGLRLGRLGLHSRRDAGVSRLPHKSVDRVGDELAVVVIRLGLARKLAGRGRDHLTVRIAAGRLNRRGRSALSIYDGDVASAAGAAVVGEIENEVLVVVKVYATHTQLTHS